MKLAPLIHSRTYSCDFSPEFKVRPKDFLDSDIKWARKAVLDATAAIDSLQGERWMIVDNARWRIAGVVGFLKDICAHCDLPAVELATAEELFYDNKGRKTYAFIGVVIPASDRGEKFDLTYTFLWKKFCELVQPIWKRSYQELISADFEPYPTSNSTFDQPRTEAQHVGKMEIFESSPGLDHDLFRYYLSGRGASSISYCSNITDIAVLRSCGFSAVTTTRNLITRLSRGSTHTASQSVGIGASDFAAFEDTQSTADIPVSSPAEKENKESKKKRFHPSRRCLMIFVIAILMFLLVAAGISGLKLLAGIATRLIPAIV